MLICVSHQREKVMKTVNTTGFPTVRGDNRALASGLSGVQLDNHDSYFD